MSNNSYWYLKKQNKVTGPFAKGLIQQHIILGRIQAGDLVSQNKKTWQTVSSAVELIPDQVKHKDDKNNGERLKAAKRWADDRDSDRGGIKDAGHRRKKITHIEIHVFSLKALIVFVLIVALALYAAFYFTPKKPSDIVKCGAKPISGIVLDGCDLSGKNLAGLDLHHSSFKNARLINTNLKQGTLSHSKMQYSVMDKSDLTEAKLDNTDLTAVSFAGALLVNTDFTNANLRYANFKQARAKNIKLKGAILSKAVWFNGKVCAEASVGLCLISKKGNSL